MTFDVLDVLLVYAVQCTLMLEKLNVLFCIGATDTRTSVKIGKLESMAASMHSVPVDIFPMPHLSHWVLFFSLAKFLPWHTSQSEDPLLFANRPGSQNSHFVEPSVEDVPG